MAAVADPPPTRGRSPRLASLQSGLRVSRKDSRATLSFTERRVRSPPRRRRGFAGPDCSGRTCRYRSLLPSLSRRGGGARCNEPGWIPNGGSCCERCSSTAAPPLFSILFGFGMAIMARSARSSVSVASLVRLTPAELSAGWIPCGGSFDGDVERRSSRRRI